MSISAIKVGFSSIEKAHRSGPQPVSAQSAISLYFELKVADL
jgi:hypothetical protein